MAEGEFDLRAMQRERHQGGGGQQAAAPLASRRSWSSTADGEGGINLVAEPMCLGIGCLVLLGVTLITLLMSMAVVHPTEYGLKYNRFFMSVSKEHYPPGRYLIGPLSSMLTFPSVVRTIKLSNDKDANGPPLKTRTDEGLDLTAHVAFQYKLKPEALYDLYNSYFDQYSNIFMRQGASRLLAVASTYRAVEYWTSRAEIGDRMFQGLKDEFKSIADITGLQLMIIDLPSSFEDKIVETEVQRQIEQTMQAMQVAAVTRAEIQVMLSNYAREEQIILSGATANATLLKRQAEAEAMQTRINYEFEAMTGVQEKIGLDAQGLVSYQRGIAYQNLDSSTFLFGVQQAAAIVNKAG